MSGILSLLLLLSAPRLFLSQLLVRLDNRRLPAWVCFALVMSINVLRLPNSFSDVWET